MKNHLWWITESWYRNLKSYDYVRCAPTYVVHLVCTCARHPITILKTGKHDFYYNSLFITFDSIIYILVCTHVIFQCVFKLSIFREQQSWNSFGENLVGLLFTRYNHIVYCPHDGRQMSNECTILLFQEYEF